MKFFSFHSFIEKSAARLSVASLALFENHGYNTLNSLLMKMVLAMKSAALNIQIRLFLGLIW